MIPRIYVLLILRNITVLKFKRGHVEIFACAVLCIQLFEISIIRGAYNLMQKAQSTYSFLPVIKKGPKQVSLRQEA